ncbi:hypothetical protein [Enterococcus hermanniensis]|uniref:hypothetical protein n=1 Tax=Enterococcus hermanniensis TaxID=249189 RepID=UPI000A52300F|nr:hypothetical protein [Enterococcus hermanniensis]
MLRRLLNALLATFIYLIVSNIGNLFFAITPRYSWTTTLWEALFFFIFIFLIQQFRKK